MPEPVPPPAPFIPPSQRSSVPGINARIRGDQVVYYLGSTTISSESLVSARGNSFEYHRSTFEILSASELDPAKQAALLEEFRQTLRESATIGGFYTAATNDATAKLITEEPLAIAEKLAASMPKDPVIKAFVNDTNIELLKKNDPKAIAQLQEIIANIPEFSGKGGRAKLSNLVRAALVERGKSAEYYKAYSESVNLQITRMGFDGPEHLALGNDKIVLIGQDKFGAGIIQINEPEFKARAEKVREKAVERLQKQIEAARADLLEKAKKGSARNPYQPRLTDAQAVSEFERLYAMMPADKAKALFDYAVSRPNMDVIMVGGIDASLLYAAEAGGEVREVGGFSSASRDAFVNTTQSSNALWILGEEGRHAAIRTLYDNIGAQPTTGPGDIRTALFEEAFAADLKLNGGNKPDLIANLHLSTMYKEGATLFSGEYPAEIPVKLLGLMAEGRLNPANAPHLTRFVNDVIIGDLESKQKTGKIQTIDGAAYRKANAMAELQRAPAATIMFRGAPQPDLVIPIDLLNSPQSKMSLAEFTKAMEELGIPKAEFKEGVMVKNGYRAIVDPATADYVQKRYGLEIKPEVIVVPAELLKQVDPRMAEALFQTARQKIEMTNVAEIEGFRRTLAESSRQVASPAVKQEQQSPKPANQESFEKFRQQLAERMVRSYGKKTGLTIEMALLSMDERGRVSQDVIKHLIAGKPATEIFKPPPPLPTAGAVVGRAQLNTNFDSLFHITGINDASYQLLKDTLIADLERLARTEPNFKPKIRFNDKAKQIEVGYSYDEFKAILPRDNKVLALLPTKKNPYLSDNSMNGSERGFVGMEAGDVLVKPGENKPFGYNAKFTNFDQLRDQFFELKRTRPPLMEGPPPAEGASAVKSMVSQAGSNGQPVRLVVGEYHNEVTARRMIIEAMPELKKSGSALALEHFFYESHQATLDAWIKDGNPKSEMPYELRRYVEQLDAQYGLGQGDRTGFKDILLSAKQNGVRVIAIDTEAARANVSNAGSSGSRVPDMNYVSAQILAKEVGKGNVVALVGSYHAGTHHEGTGKNKVFVPGIAELIGGTSLSIRESEGVSPQLTSKGLLGTAGDGVVSDILVTTDPRYVAEPGGKAKGISADESVVIMANKFDIDKATLEQEQKAKERLTQRVNDDESLSPTDQSLLRTLTLRDTLRGSSNEGRIFRSKTPDGEVVRIAGAPEELQAIQGMLRRQDVNSRIGVLSQTGARPILEIAVADMARFRELLPRDISYAGIPDKPSAKLLASPVPEGFPPQGYIDLEQKGAGTDSVINGKDYQQDRILIRRSPALTEAQAADLLARSAAGMVADAAGHKNHGSTFTGAVVTENGNIVTANLGDSPAFAVVVDPQTGKAEIIRLTDNHNVSNASAELPNGGFQRDGRMYRPDGTGGIALNRSIGDSSFPDMGRTQISVPMT